MTLRTRKASWFVSGLLLVSVVSASFRLVGAQPKAEAPRPAFGAGEPVFESLSENYVVNLDKIAYTSDDDDEFNIYFACSSVRGSDPFRLSDPKDIKQAQSYFNDEKRYGKRFVKVGKYCINVRHIAYIESKDDSVVVRFSARILDSFIRLDLSGADAESFRKKMREF